MINFYFSEISYPRFTIHDLVSEFLKKDFEPLLDFNENADYKNKFGTTFISASENSFRISSAS